MLTFALGQPAWSVYAVVAVLVYLESALVVGVVLPGEAAALVGGVTVALGNTSLVGTAAVVIAAALLGDTTAYLLGRRFGPRLVALRVGGADAGVTGGRRLGRVGTRVGRTVLMAQERLVRRGPASLVLARFTPVVRTVAPALAGSGRMPYPTFLRWNGTGVVAWGVGCVVAGAVAGESWEAVAGVLGWGSVVACALVVGWMVVRGVRRARAAGEEEGPVAAVA